MIQFTKNHPTLIAKTASLVLSVVAMFALGEQHLTGHLGALFVMVIGAESVVFLNSILPYGMFSVVLASMLLQTHDYIPLCFGFISALIANYISYWIGRYVVIPGSQEHTQAPFVSLSLRALGTFWHPQFASIEAFECGTEGIPFLRYARASFGPALFWYSVMCTVFSFFPVPVDSHTFFIVSMLMLLGWIIWELAALVRHSGKIS